jgi:hypothetical protein
MVLFIVKTMKCHYCFNFTEFGTILSMQRKLSMSLDKNIFIGRPIGYQNVNSLIFCLNGFLIIIGKEDQLS